MSRTEMRELAFKLIYSLEVQKTEDLEEQIDLYIQQNEIENEATIEYIKDMIFGINKNSEDIKSIVKSCLSEKWTIER